MSRAGGHAERGGDRRRGVAGAERVVLALAALEEAGDAVLLAQRLACDRCGPVRSLCG